MEFATDKLYDQSGRLDPDYAGELTVCTIGGSLTEGGHEWLEMVQLYLASLFPHARVNLYNGGLGGTGSVAGAMRFDTEVSAHKPDIVFIEFTVNDGAGNPAGCTAATESMLRRCLALDPIPAVIYLHTVMPRDPGSDGWFDHMRAIGLKEVLARHYGLPTIGIYDYVLRKYRHDCIPGERFEEFLVRAGYYKLNARGAVDVHPYPNGYRLYGEAILEAFRSYGASYYLRRPRTDIPLFSDPSLHGVATARYTCRAVGEEDGGELVLSRRAGITYGAGWTLIEERTSCMRYVPAEGEATVRYRLNGLMYADNRVHRLVRTVGDTSAITDRGPSFYFESDADAFALTFRSIYYNRPLRYYELVDGVWTLLAETSPTSVNSKPDGAGQTFYDRLIPMTPGQSLHRIMAVVAVSAEGGNAPTDRSGDPPVQGGSASAAVTDVSGYSFRFGMLTEQYLGR